MLLSATLAACVPGPGPPPAEPIVGGSVNQVYVIKAPAGAGVQLVDGNGATVDSGTADSLGGYLFRRVPAGADYRVVTTSARRDRHVEPGHGDHARRRPAADALLGPAAHDRRQRHRVRLPPHP